MVFISNSDAFSAKFSVPSAAGAGLFSSSCLTVDETVPEASLVALSKFWHRGHRTVKFPLGIFDSSSWSETEQLSQRIIILMNAISCFLFHQIQD